MTLRLLIRHALAELPRSPDPLLSRPVTRAAVTMSVSVEMSPHKACPTLLGRQSGAEESETGGGGAVVALDLAAHRQPEEKANGKESGDKHRGVLQASGSQPTGSTVRAGSKVGRQSDADLQQMVHRLSQLAIKHGYVLSSIKQDTSLFLFVKPGPERLIPILFAASEKWHQTQKEAPRLVDSSVRIVPMKVLLIELGKSHSGVGQRRDNASGQGGSGKLFVGIRHRSGCKRFEVRQQHRRRSW